MNDPAIPPGPARDALPYDDAQDDGSQPYCASCGEWAGMFLGMDGWHHFRGDPRPGGIPELFDPGHEPDVAWRPAPAGPMPGGGWVSGSCRP